MSTVELLGGVNQGNTRDIDELVSKLYPEVLRIVERELPPEIAKRFDATEVAQDVILSSLKLLSKLRISETAQIRTLLLHIVRNALSHDYLLRKRRSTMKEVSEVISLESTVAGAGRNQESKAQESDREERVSMLKAGIALLDAQHQVVLMKRYFDGLSLEEIAKELGTSTSVAKVRLSRATAKLAMIMRSLREGDFRGVGAGDLP